MFGLWLLFLNLLLVFHQSNVSHALNIFKSKQLCMISTCLSSFNSCSNHIIQSNSIQYSVVFLSHPKYKELLGTSILSKSVKMDPSNSIVNKHACQFSKNLFVSQITTKHVTLQGKKKEGQSFYWIELVRSKVMEVTKGALRYLLVEAVCENTIEIPFEERNNEMQFVTTDQMEEERTVVGAAAEAGILEVTTNQKRVQNWVRKSLKPARCRSKGVLGSAELDQREELTLSGNLQ